MGGVGEENDAETGHHQQVRFQWGLGPRDAEPLIIGFDVLIVDDDGRIAEVRGFLDKVPS